MKNIKEQLREYLDIKLRLCGKYMNEEQDFHLAKAQMEQAVGAVEFISVTCRDINLAHEAMDTYLQNYEQEFYKTLFPEVEA